LGEAGRALVARGLSEDEAAVVEADPELGRWLEAALAVHPHPRSVASWLLSELRREAQGRALADLPIGPDAVGRLAALVDAGALTTPLARQVLAVLVAEGGTPEAVVRDRGLAPLTDDAAVRALVAEAFAAFPDKLAALRSGRTGLLGFFVGEVLRRSEGRADPKVVRALVEAALR
jgi:Asp-tRNA(Asn)/Glu-tRNA(Gln) amidotransferase B subunit